MSGFVEVIMNNFAKINKRAFLHLNFDSCVKFDTRCMDKANIPDVVLVVNLTDHELGFPQFLIIGHMVMSGFSFTYFEKSSIAIEPNLDIFKLLGINLFEPKNKSLFRDVKTFGVLDSSHKITVFISSDSCKSGFSDIRSFIFEKFKFV